VVVFVETAQLQRSSTHLERLRVLHGTMDRGLQRSDADAAYHSTKDHLD
jgi:hypothetical protein